MADFDLFESLVTAESEGQLHQAALEKNLKSACFQVRRQFGNYLANAESTGDYTERFSLVSGKIKTLVSDHVEPTREVLAWVENELVPDTLKQSGNNEKRSKLARHSTGSQKTSHQPRDPRSIVGGADWNWDTESNSFKSTKSSNFQCVCGSAIGGVGQHECACGRLWNMHSITDGNKTAATPLYVCREVMRRDTVLASKKADKIDPKDPHKHDKSDEWEYSDGYDVKDLIGPAAGEEEHDGHLSALDMIFAADDEEFPEEPMPDDGGNQDIGGMTGEAPPEDVPPAPMPVAQPSPMDMLTGDPAGIEDQPAEDADIQQAQQAILDMILREKSEEVVEDTNNDDEIENLNDAYQSLDVVQDLENAESPMPGASMLAYRAAMQQGYVLGFLEALASAHEGGSYDERSTDFEGFEPPIKGVSNGLDDADATPGKDTTPELRNLLKDQFDSDNAANKDQKPLDPAEPFGPDKGKSSRFHHSR